MLKSARNAEMRIEMCKCRHSAPTSTVAASAATVCTASSLTTPGGKVAFACERARGAGDEASLRDAFRSRASNGGSEGLSTCGRFVRLTHSCSPHESSIWSPCSFHVHSRIHIHLHQHVHVHVHVHVHAQAHVHAHVHAHVEGEWGREERAARLITSLTMLSMS